MGQHLKLHLEDHGQDFLCFTVAMDEDGFYGTIVDTQPFQGWVWNGRRITATSMVPGRRPVFAAPKSAVLNYAVAEVEPISEPGKVTVCRHTGARMVERIGLCRECADTGCALNTWSPQR